MAAYTGRRATSIGFACGWLADRLRGPLEELKAWLQANNAAVMSVLLLVIGVVVIGKGIGGLS